MKRKTKFMTAILSKDEWKLIKISMKWIQEYLDDSVGYAIIRGDKAQRKMYQHLLNIVKHFNSISVDSIEELADKIERERRKKSRDKPQQKAS